jgi:hypothetical protein
MALRYGAFLAALATLGAAVLLWTWRHNPFPTAIPAWDRLTTLIDGTTTRPEPNGQIPAIARNQLRFERHGKDPPSRYGPPHTYLAARL